MTIEEKHQGMGNIFAGIRKERGISQEAIGENIASQRMVSHLENRGELPGHLVLNALVERLGKSADYFITMLTKQEYEYLKWRQEVLEHIQRGRTEDAIGLLNNSMGASRNIHERLQEQFTRFWLGYEENRLEEMKEAISLTVPHFSPILSTDQCVGSSELLLILMYLEKKFQLEPDSPKQEQKLLKSLLIYMEFNYQPEEQIKVYPTAVCLYGEHMEEDVTYEKLSFYKKAFMLLQKQESLCEITRILEGLIRESKRVGIQDVSKYEEYLWTFSTIKEEFGISDHTLLSGEIRQKKYLLHEVLKTYRKERELNIIELSDFACGEKTYRELERGKRKAYKSTYQVLSDALDIPFGTYSSEIYTDDYACLQMTDETKHLIRCQRFKEALEMTKALEERLDMSIPENEQFIEMERNISLYLSKQMEQKEFEEKLERSICLTIPGWAPDYGTHFYTKVEMTLVYHRAIAYSFSEQPEKGIALLENLWKNIEKSEMDNQNYFEELLLVLVLWKDLLTDVHEYDKALEKARKGIELCFESGKGAKLHAFILEWGWIMERHNSENTEKKNYTKCASYFLQALCVSELYGINNNVEIIRNYCKEKKYNFNDLVCLEDHYKA